MRARLWVVLLVLAACAPSPAPALQSDLRPATTVPTPDATNTAALCTHLTDADSLSTRIDLLEALYMAKVTCDGLNTAEALYVAYTDYGEQLAARGRDREAQAAFTTALEYTPTDSRAADNLAVRTDAPTLTTCTDEESRIARAAVPAFINSNLAPVTVDGGTLNAGDEPFAVRGIIYEPRSAPGSLVWQNAATTTFDRELTLIAEAGFNTIRVYLHHDALFQCPGSGAVPVSAAISRLDSLIYTAANLQLRVIAVMNHEVDAPLLYGNAPHTTAQMIYLLERYAHEPTVIAWDMRDSGNADYTDGDTNRETVLAWLTQATQLTRRTAPNQLVTAGWRDDAAATAPIVDFVSFQQYGSLDDLRQQIALLRSQTTRPLLLAGVGYPQSAGDELGQRDQLYDALLAAENNNLLGWSVYKAFDHPNSVCDGCERFGLWNTQYIPKLSLDAPRVIISGP